MGKTKAFIFSLVLILLPSFSWAWSGEVVGASGGDTIAALNSKTLKAVKIRLYGIDCPEGEQASSKRAKQLKLPAASCGECARCSIFNSDLGLMIRFAKIKQ